MKKIPFLIRLFDIQNVDVKAISLILSGLARCGAFGVFDEFNRLQESVLSVLSMIIQPIQTAIQQKSDSVTIFDEKVRTKLFFLEFSMDE